MAAADLRWVATGATYTLWANLDPAELDAGFSYVARLDAALGAAHLRWEQEVVGPAGETSIVVAPPPEAFLDPLAEDYVTGLSVALLAQQEGRTVWIAHAPAAFLAWPDGADRDPVVWDRAMEENAPLGVLDPALRATVDDPSVTRILPPIYATVRTPDDAIATLPEEG